MRNPLRGWKVGLWACLSLLCGLLTPAHALTRAGTPIDNIAICTFDANGVAKSVESPLARTVVAAVPAVTLTAGRDISVYPGQEAVITHRLQNTGNAPLSVEMAAAGGTWERALAIDRNGNGEIDPGEESFATPLSIDVDETVIILIRVSVPALAPEGAANSFTLRADDSGSTATASAADRLTVRSDAPAIIKLVADPSTILGNGKERSKLTATVLTARRTPVPDGTPVAFTTAKGVFENGLQTFEMTTTGGLAVTYLTANFLSTVPVKTLTRIVAGTPLTGTAEAEVEITFSPAAVAGLVSDREGYRPVPNLPARLLGPDGALAGSMATREDGTYTLFVPREGEYTIEIPVLNAVGDLVVIRQHISVDRLGGAVFNPEGAVVGVVMDVLTRDPVGGTVLEFTLESVTTRASRSRAIAPGDKILITTDARGGFAINGLPLGRYVFLVTSADERHYPFGRVVVDLTRAGEYVVNANILLDPFGYVYDGETGAWIPEASVTLLDADTGQVVSLPDGENPTRTAADGVYRLLVVPGRYRLRVAAAGYLTYLGDAFDVTRAVVNINVPLVPLPVLAMEKRLDSANPVPGGRLQYSITATNTGIGTARNVSLVDVLPEHLTPVPGTLGANASYDASTRRITWAIGDLPRLTGRAEVTFQAQLDTTLPEGSTSLVNVAFVTGDGIPEPGSTPGAGDLSVPVASSPVAVQVTAGPDLGIEKSTQQAQVAVGESARFTIRFWNRGTGPALQVTVTDTLPAGLALPDGQRSVTWRIERLDAGAEQTRTLEVVGDASGLEPGVHQVTNRVTIASSTVPAIEATASLRVLVPYLRVTKRALVSEVESGDVVPFELIVENLSATDEATAVDVRDLLPQVLHYRPGTSRLDGQPTPDPSRTRGALTWRLARLAPGTTARLTFHTIVAVGHGGAGDIVNTADATALAPTGQRLTAPESRATIRRRVGFFSDRGLILGRLFVDRNGNRLPDRDEPGVANVAVFSDSGVMAITDGEGKYVMPDVTPGEHVIRVDLTTIPRGYKLTRIDSANAGKPHSRFTHLSRGGIAKANFAFIGEGPTVGSAQPGTQFLVAPEEARR